MSVDAHFRRAFMPKPTQVSTNAAKGPRDNSNKPYEAGRGKAPKATRFQKGKSGNPKGRPRKKDEDFDPGKILEAIDNEQCVFIHNGKRKVLRNREVSFRLLFSEAIEGNFEAACAIKQFAEEYLKPEAEGPSQAVFVVVPDGSSSPPRRSGRQRKKDLLPVSAGFLFRKVAQQHGKLNGVRMTMWEAYLRQVNEMANENKRAARLLQQLRKAFPGEAPPGKTQIYLITEADAEL
jgi:hypothetical protein